MTYQIKIKDIDSYWFNSRLNFVIIVILFTFVLLLGRLFFLQIVNGEQFRSLSEQNSTKSSKILPSRGLIFDKNGKLLVENKPYFDLCIDISITKNVDALIKKIALITLLDFDELINNFYQKKLSKCEKYIVLKSNIDRESLATIRANRYTMPGVEINTNYKRNYIYGSSLSHLLGYIGKIGLEDLSNRKIYTNYKIDDVIGKYGIERSKEIELRGKNGNLWNRVNASGKIIEEIDTNEAIPGYNITLTIDHDLQLFSESMLNGKIGAMVALDPSTGEILSMVSSPSYDQNIFIFGISETEWLSMASDSKNPFANRAIQGQYPPASIYKIITAVAGLEKNVIDENTEILCKGYHMLEGSKYLCWKANGHGKMNVISALAESCDVFFYTLGHRLGVDCLAKYAKLFGLGSISGIDLASEAKGLVPTPDWKKKMRGTSWQPGETLSVAIGQSSNLVTPLQMAIMISTIANNGHRYRPLIVKNIRESSGIYHYKNHPDLLSILPIKKRTIETVQEGLNQVIKSKRGTARSILSRNINISGKTGTAQIVGRRNNSSFEQSKYKIKRFKEHAWFVGYAPSNNPKIALAIVIEHGGNGSKIAAPIGAAIFEYYLNKDKIKNKKIAIAGQ